jgi:hypothetical protein
MASSREFDTISEVSSGRYSLSLSRPGLNSRANIAADAGAFTVSVEATTVRPTATRVRNCTSKDSAAVDETRVTRNGNATEPCAGTRTGTAPRPFARVAAGPVGLTSMASLGTSGRTFAFTAASLGLVTTTTTLFVSPAGREMVLGVRATVTGDAAYDGPPRLMATGRYATRTPSPSIAIFVRAWTRCMAAPVVTARPPPERRVLARYSIVLAPRPAVNASSSFTIGWSRRPRG